MLNNKHHSIGQGLIVIGLLFGFSKHDSYAKQAKFSPIPKSLTLKKELEQQGVTITTNKTFYPNEKSFTALVATIPMKESLKYQRLLELKSIPSGDSCDLGACGIYVDIRDFYRSAKILRKVVPSDKRYWVWHPKGKTRISPRKRL
ncbi:MAG: hypothetical protein QM758_25380 [Armatimonas sp.]